VQPPGKIIKNLSALSGGEQAFVAIAIYFAILHVKPAPFCLLDESKRRSTRQRCKIRKLPAQITKNTQFITITHRRGTWRRRTFCMASPCRRRVSPSCCS
jgi:chromosome segregation protein